MPSNLPQMITLSPLSPMQMPDVGGKEWYRVVNRLGCAAAHQ